MHEEGLRELSPASSELVERGDLDELTRHVNRLVASADWAELAELSGSGGDLSAFPAVGDGGGFGAAPMESSGAGSIGGARRASKSKGKGGKKGKGGGRVTPKAR